MKKLKSFSSTDESSITRYVNKEEIKQEDIQEIIFNPYLNLIILFYWVEDEDL